MSTPPIPLATIGTSALSPRPVNQDHLEPQLTNSSINITTSYRIGKLFENASLFHSRLECMQTLTLSILWIAVTFTGFETDIMDSLVISMSLVCSSWSLVSNLVIHPHENPDHQEVGTTNNLASSPRSILRIKITGYRLLCTTLLSSFGITKAVLSYTDSTAPTTLDWIIGVLITTSLQWIGHYESVGVAPWFYDADYGWHVFKALSVLVEFCIVVAAMFYLFPLNIIRGSVLQSEGAESPRVVTQYGKVAALTLGILLLFAVCEGGLALLFSAGLYSTGRVKMAGAHLSTRFSFLLYAVATSSLIFRLWVKFDPQVGENILKLCLERFDFGSMITSMDTKENCTYFWIQDSSGGFIFLRAPESYRVHLPPQFFRPICGLLGGIFSAYYFRAALGSVVANELARSAELEIFSTALTTVPLTE